MIQHGRMAPPTIAVDISRLYTSTFDASITANLSTRFAITKMRLSYPAVWYIGLLAAISAVSAQSAQELINSVLNPDPNDETFASYSSLVYYNASLYN